MFVKWVYNFIMNRGIATFTLDTGHCPPWLFERMVKLGREMAILMVDEYGPDEFIKRIGDPVWFQSLGTVLAFDWNASGLTTILTASLKESLRGLERDLGIFICGGKGKTSRKTPEQIADWSEVTNLGEGAANSLVKASKMTAKVDSSLIQDNYTLYHHAFFFTKNGAWTVVQQGMDTESSTARRYHWHDSLVGKNFIEEPHSGISAQILKSKVLDMTSKKSSGARDVSVYLGQGNYSTVMKDVEILRKYSNRQSKTIKLKNGSEQLTLLKLERQDFKHHNAEVEDFSKSKYLEKILQKITYEKPKTYEELLATEGVGGKTVRALALVAEVLYGADVSYEDPARYSFAHGGKDAIPYPVDRPTYDKSIELLRTAVKRAKIGFSEEEKALQRVERVERQFTLSS